MKKFSTHTHLEESLFLFVFVFIIIFDAFFFFEETGGWWQSAKYFNKKEVKKRIVCCGVVFMNIFLLLLFSLFVYLFFLLLFLFHFLFRSIFAEIHMFCGGGNGIKKFFILFSFPLGSLFFSLICHHIGIVILEYVFLLLYQKFANISLEYCFLLWPQKPTKKNYGECQRSHGMEYYICKTLQAKKLVVVCYKLLQLEITVGYSDIKAHFFL